MSGFSEVSDFFPALRRGFLNHLMDHAVVPEGEGRILEIERTLMDGHGAVLAARCVLELLRPIVTGIGGRDGAAATVAAVVAGLGSLEDRHLRVFSIDAGRVLGAIDGSDRTALIAGYATDVALFEETIAAVQAERRAAVVQCIALVDASGGAAAARCADVSIPFIAIATPADLGME